MALDKFIGKLLYFNLTIIFKRLKKIMKIVGTKKIIFKIIQFFINTFNLFIFLLILHPQLAMIPKKYIMILKD